MAGRTRTIPCPSHVTPLLALCVVVCALLTSNMVQAGCPIAEEYAAYCTCDEADDNAEIIDLINCRNVGHVNGSDVPAVIDPDSSSAYQIIRRLEFTLSHVTRVPNGTFDFMRVRVLSLARIGIEEIEVDAFQGLIGQYLEQLDLNGNSLTELPAGLFRDCVELQTLSISGNQLHSLGAGVFQGLTHLVYLYLEKNNMEHIDRNVFKGLASLKSLRLYENNLTSLAPEVFLELFNMEDLNIRDNRIETLPSNLFSKMDLVRRIDISLNRIRFLSGDVFQSNSELSWLDLAVNRLEEIEVGAFYGLSKLEYLDLSSNNLTVIGGSLFETNAELARLYLDHNRLQALTDLAFEGSRKLKLLHLHQNNISMIASDTFGSLSVLEMLTLQGNGIKEIPYAAFDSLRTVQEINLANNNLEGLEEGTFDALRMLRKLNLRDNRIDGLSPRWMRRMENLTDLDLSGNRIKILGSGIFRSLTSLDRLDLSRNPLQALQSEDFENQAGLEVLYLNNTCLTAPPDGVFQELSGLRQLYLQSNGMRYVLNNTFWGLPNLTELRLDYNGLEDIAVGVFRSSHLPKLTYLGLSHNRLQNNQLRNAMSSLSVTLERVDVSSNLLDSLEGISTAGLSGLDELVVSGNPFVCDCQRLQWLQYMPASYNPGLSWCQPSSQRFAYYRLVCAFAEQGCNVSTELPYQDSCQDDSLVTDDVVNSPLFDPGYRPEYVDVGICDPNRYTTTTQSTVRVPTTTGRDVTEPGTAPPMVPLFVNISDVEDGSATIHWFIAKEYHSNIRAFRVTYQESDDDVDVTTIFINDPEHMTQSIGDLDPEKDYVVCVHVLVEDDTRDSNGEVCELVSFAKSSTSEISAFPMIPIIAACVGGGVILLTIILVVCVLQHKKRQEKKQAMAEEQTEDVHDRVGMWMESAMPGMDKDEAMVAQEHTTIALDTYNQPDVTYGTTPADITADIPDNIPDNASDRIPDNVPDDTYSDIVAKGDVNPELMSADDKCY